MLFLSPELPSTGALSFSPSRKGVIGLPPSSHSSFAKGMPVRPFRKIASRGWRLSMLTNLPWMQHISINLHVAAIPLIAGRAPSRGQSSVSAVGSNANSSAERFSSLRPGSAASLSTSSSSAAAVGGNASSTPVSTMASTFSDVIHIHPSACVHPDAIVNEGTEIGPFCSVGPGVELGANCKLHAGSHVFGNTVIGDRCTLMTGAVVGADIPGTTIIGCDNKIGYHAVVGVACQDMKYKEGSECFLVIGDGNDVREHASIHRSSKPDDVTVIGNKNLIMGSCHVAHDCKIGNRNILANATLLAGHVVVGDFVHTGGAVAVHQFCHIGSYAFLAGGSMVVRDVPVFTMVAGDRAELRGLNLEGLRRCGFSDSEVRSIRSAYQKLFMSTDLSVGLEERLADLEVKAKESGDVLVKRLLDSVQSSFADGRRGICKFRHWTAVD